MPPPPPPPSLPDDLLEEIFLRLPPDEPENLVRTSLASMLWFGRLSGPRYREHHGAPLMLGFLHAWLEGCGPEEKGRVPHFTSTTKFGAHIPNEWGYSAYTAWDCRHGRVLLGDANHSSKALVVWDPMTGCRREPPRPYMLHNSHRAAVLCAVSGCDHRTCHAAPFQVVCVGLYRKGEYDDDCVAHACVSLPETGDWNRPCPPRFDFNVWGEPCLALHLPDDALIDPMPPVLVEEALHFMLEYDGDDSVQILKYDLRSNGLSLIDAPIVDSDIASAAILMVMEDGSLGFAHVDGLTLYIWSRRMDSNRVASWSRRTIIDLRNLLPIQNPKERLILVGSVEGSDTIFVTTDLGIYEINVKSQQWKKLWKRENFRALIPYMSFYNP